MRNIIKKLILEEIGDTKEEYRLFGENLVNGLRKDDKFKTPFSSQRDLDERSDYFESKYNLKKIGRGFFRVVYQTENPEIVLKFATTNKSQIVRGGKITSAMECNLQEVKRFNRYPEFFPKSFAYDPEGKWLLVEKVENIVTNNKELNSAILSNFSSFKLLKEETINQIRNYIGLMYKGLATKNLEDQYELYYKIRKEVDSFFNEDMTLNYFYNFLKKSESDIEYEKALFDIIHWTIKWCCDEIVFYSHIIKDADDDITKKIVRSLKNPIVKQNIANKSFNHLSRDRKLKRFYNMIKWEKIPIREIRKENIGIDSNGNIKIIDATIL